MVLVFLLIIMNNRCDMFVHPPFSLSDHMWDDGNSLGPKEVHSYLTRVMYNRRNKFDPLWNSLVIGGVKKGPKGEEKYLGMVYSLAKRIVSFH